MIGLNLIILIMLLYLFCHYILEENTNYFSFSTVIFFKVIKIKMNYFFVFKKIYYLILKNFKNIFLKIKSKNSKKVETFVIIIQVLNLCLIFK